MKMKKPIIALLTAAMAVSVFGAGALAHNHHNGNHHSGTGSGYSSHCGYIDENHDGICDNCKTGSGMAGCTGHCTSYIEKGYCDCNTLVYAYIDKNRNGFCDNCGGVRKTSALRYKYAVCGCTEIVCNFIDENNDGLCDECATARSNYIASCKRCY